MTNDRRERIGADEDIPDTLHSQKEAEEYFTEAKLKFDRDLSDVLLKWRDMGTSSGETRREEDDIEVTLNPKLIEKASHEVPITILHELAHAAQFKEVIKKNREDDSVVTYTTKGHDRLWRQKMRKAGIDNPEMYLNLEVNLADNYIIECQNCGNQVGRKKKSKVIKNPKKYVCGHCNEPETFERIK